MALVGCMSFSSSMETMLSTPSITDLLGRKVQDEAQVLSKNQVTEDENQEAYNDLDCQVICRQSVGGSILRRCSDPVDGPSSRLDFFGRIIDHVQKRHHISFKDAMPGQPLQEIFSINVQEHNNPKKKKGAKGCNCNVV